MQPNFPALNYILLILQNIPQLLAREGLELNKPVKHSDKQNPSKKEILLGKASSYLEDEKLIVHSKEKGIKQEYTIGNVKYYPLAYSNFKSYLGKENKLESGSELKKASKILKHTLKFLGSKKVQWDQNVIWMLEILYSHVKKPKEYFYLVALICVQTKYFTSKGYKNGFGLFGFKNKQIQKIANQSCKAYYQNQPTNLNSVFIIEVFDQLQYYKQFKKNLKKEKDHSFKKVFSKFIKEVKAPKEKVYECYKKLSKGVKENDD